MAIVALQGIHGGVGTTCTAAALGWALYQLGKRVLVVDGSPTDQLGIHFNQPLSPRGGWASALLDGREWWAAAWRYTEGLDFLPFGDVDDAQQDSLQRHMAQPGWHSVFASLRQRYDWIVVDADRSDTPGARYWGALSDLRLLLLIPDANCHLRLHRQTLPADIHLLTTQLFPGSVLQEDIYLLWQQTLPSLMPLALHRDEAVAEAAVGKQPVGEYAPRSLAAQEMTSLAAWCLLQDLPASGNTGGDRE